MAISRRTTPELRRHPIGAEGNIEAKTCSDDTFDLGLATIRTSYGNKVRVYA